MKRVNCIKLLIIIILFLIITIFTWYYRVIHVEYIGYAIENQNINVPGYYATLTVKTTKENLEKMLEALSASDEYGIILRAKGMLPAEDGTWIYFDMVPEETEIREGAPEYTGRLCVIGSKLNEDKLAELFGL